MKRISPAKYTAGFLKEPEGADEAFTLSAGEVRKLAAGLDPSAFIAPYYTVNGKKLGPADLLYAMFDICLGAEKATIEPGRPQQCDYSRLPALASLNLRGSWMHSPDFEDKYITDRARLQAWTLRTED